MENICHHHRCRILAFQIVNICANDSQRLYDVCLLGNYIISSLVMLLAALVAVQVIIGTGALIGTAITYLIFLPLTVSHVTFIHLRFRRNKTYILKKPSINLNSKTWIHLIFPQSRHAFYVNFVFLIILYFHSICLFFGWSFFPGCFPFSLSLTACLSVWLFGYNYV